MYAWRSIGGGASSAAAASGVGWPTSGSPVMLMTEIRLMTRRGCSMAMVWAIMPPIDAPMHVRPLDAERVEQADRVGGHVAERVRHRDVDTAAR